MRRRRLHLPRWSFAALAILIVAAMSAFSATSTVSQTPQRNAIIFIADGLRPSSVNEKDAPTLLSVRQEGVHFINSHSLFPTFTTANASAIATGHYLGDTGDFSNTIFSDFPVPNSAGTITPFLENDAVLADVNDRFNQNYLNEETLLALARKAGYSTAAIGKLGPVAIQDVTQVNRVNGVVPIPQTVIVDDSTGKTGGIPLPTDVTAVLTSDAYFTNTYVPTYTAASTIAPARTNGAPACTSPGVPAQCRDSNGFSGNNTTPGTDQPNTFQQKYFVDVLTRAVLPTFKNRGKPFVAVYWSRDPDGTQHNQGDSLGSLLPGINGPTARAAVKNADANLKQILETLKQLRLDQTTDVVITADHGFSTISKSVVSRSGTFTKSYAATQTYSGVNTGFLPVGFVAIDLAHFLNLPLYDADTPIVPLDSTGNVTYATVKPGEPVTPTQLQFPRNGDGVIGGGGQVINGKTDASVVVAANGGSDLIYLPSGNPTQANGKTLIENLVDFLSSQDYISGIFADDTFGNIPGALPLSAINLKGTALTPTPALAINFRTFSVSLANPLKTGVEIADSGLQQGQGMHGSFSRSDTYNNMAAIGPDFKSHFTDLLPVSNVDLPLTIAKILNLTVPSTSTLQGRVLSEALAGGSNKRPDGVKTVRSAKNPVSNQETILNYQVVDKTRYFDAAGFHGRTVGLID
ncbi:MAG: alkaline phosphatase family protein [Stenomitos rutilans HA7619-LM2]|jgi:hypothetical protein|nr:alkaline phosphatase family protein [Stenomitos rutilans HA7619-LM2]